MNKPVKFKKVYFIELSGYSRKWPGDKLSFMEGIFETMLKAVVDAHNMRHSTTRARILEARTDAKI